MANGIFHHQWGNKQREGGRICQIGSSNYRLSIALYVGEVNAR